MSGSIQFYPRDLVERNIEGIVFLGRIESINRKLGTVDIRYLDDCRLERDVPLDEICKSENINSSEVAPTMQRNETLPRPLAGLVDDDYEIRNSKVPTVFVHETPTSDDSIVMNGAENRLAAGGGLRALRYLKS